MIDSLINLYTSMALDFSVLWLSAKDLLTPQNPYLNTQMFTGVGYPPNTLLFYLPLTFLDFFTAQGIFQTISFLGIGISIFLILKILKIKPVLIYFAPVLLLTLLSFPAKFTLGMGQNNFIAFSFLLASYYFWKNKKHAASGIFLGLAFCLKTIFIYFLLFYVLKKSWKTVLYSLLIFAGSVLIVFLIRGSSDLYFYYFTHVVPPLLNFTGREIYYNQGISAFVSRIIADIGLRRNITAAFSLAFIAANAYFIIKNKKKKTDLQFSFSIITLLLIDSLSWQHHFVWALFPLMVLFKSLGGKMAGRILAVASYILISINIPEISFLSSHVFLGIMILYFINLFMLI